MFYNYSPKTVITARLYLFGQACFQLESEMNGRSGMTESASAENYPDTSEYFYPF